MRGNVLKTLIVVPVVFAVFLNIIGFVVARNPVSVSNITVVDDGAPKAEFGITYPYFSYKYEIVRDFRNFRWQFSDDISDQDRNTLTSLYPGTKKLISYIKSDEFKYKNKLHLLFRISLVEITAKLEILLQRIHWDYFAIFGILIFFGSFYAREAKPMFLLWYWYAIWGVVGNLGLYAFWYRLPYMEGDQWLDAFEYIFDTHYFNWNEVYGVFTGMILLIIPLYLGIKIFAFLFLKYIPNKLFGSNKLETKGLEGKEGGDAKTKGSESND